MNQTAIPCILMRGGTSKGPFFLAHDLPADPARRDAVLLAAMGSPDVRQIDGVGGSDSLTSKVAIVGPSSHPDADVDYLFLQVVVDEPRVDTSQNCGNMLAGIGPFAIERGLVAPTGDLTKVRIHMRNTASIAVANVQTPAEMEADKELKARVERVRLAAGKLMNLGDVTKKTVPKMCLVSPPEHGGAISTRNFIPHTVHKAIGVFGAVSVATACALPGSIAAEITGDADYGSRTFEIEHPTGFFTVAMEVVPGPTGPRVDRAAQREPALSA